MAHSTDTQNDEVLNKIISTLQRSGSPLRSDELAHLLHRRVSDILPVIWLNAGRTQINVEVHAHDGRIGAPTYRYLEPDDK
ncbi:MAG: hypothetical protein ABF586_04245 [Sporolactobacillus sp.]